jgi:tetratricopeptide (TPR) repeat protein
VVLGVSNEPKKLVTETVQKTERKYAIAIVKGEKTDAFYGVKGFPSAYLLDDRGRVIWTGHPGTLEEKTITDALAKAAVVTTLPDAFKDINKLIAKQDLGKAWDAAGKALATKAGDKDLERLRTEVEKALQKKLEAAKAAAGASDFGHAVDVYEEVMSEFEGMPAASEAKAPHDAILADPNAKDDLAAAAMMKKADAEVRKGEFEKALAIWKAAAKKYASTKSGARAAAAVASHPVKGEKEKA